MPALNANTTIGFIGAGRMATALAAGLIRSGAAAVDRIVASDLSEEARDRFRDETGAEVVPSNSEVVERANVLILAVKPRYVVPLLAELTSALGPQHLLISIAAGVTLDRIEEALGSRHRLVRVMPNTPCLMGAGASAFATRNADADDAEIVTALLAASGLVVELPESLLDAVTGLSGSGPAYAFQMIEALSDGGVKVGLPRDVALQLAAQTLLG
ncbi:MAG: pyrroline-5-carboxylate reductase, partial [Planctomycetota bacterium]